MRMCVHQLNVRQEIIFFINKKKPNLKRFNFKYRLLKFILIQKQKTNTKYRAMPDGARCHIVR